MNESRFEIYRNVGTGFLAVRVTRRFRFRDMGDKIIK